MPESPRDDGNGRVTLARLEERIIAQGKLFEQRFDNIDQRIETFCESAGDREQRIRALERKQGWEVWRDIGAMFGGMITGLIAIFTGKP